ncbi:MAG: SusD/RagB family nutrient-binding outer membrane lipoprotein, partial [Hymenobacter sp.]
VDGHDINPNLPQDAPSDQQLTAAELGLGFVMSGEAARTANIWSGVFTGADRQYSSINNYLTASPDYDNMWSNTYYQTITQSRIVQQKAVLVNNKQLQGIAQVIEAQSIGTAADLWGDVPYSGILVPDSPPAFDGQVAVYAATQTTLSSAITNLGQNGVNPGTRDIFYNGSTTKWLAAAHSLKARYFLHVKNYASAITEARAGIASADGDMLMPFDGTIGSAANPYYDFLDNSRPGYMSAEGAYAAQLLQSRTNTKTDEAKRFAYFYTDQGYYALDPNFVDGAFQPNSSFPLVTYVETQAILAESLARTGDITGALTALNSIRAADATTYGGTYTAYTAADFLAGGLVNPKGGSLSQTDALLLEILQEKYLSLIGQIEEFNDVRRTNNLIGVPKNVTTAPSLPQRYLYPQSEINTNSNVPNPIPDIYTKTAVNK